MSYCIIYTAIHIILYHIYCDSYHTVSYILRFISYFIIYTAIHIILYHIFFDSYHTVSYILRFVSYCIIYSSIHIILHHIYCDSYHTVSYILRFTCVGRHILSNWDSFRLLCECAPLVMDVYKAHAGTTSLCIPYARVSLQTQVYYHHGHRAYYYFGAARQWCMLRR